jgi:hypothetical protein
VWFIALAIPFFGVINDLLARPHRRPLLTPPPPHLARCCVPFAWVDLGPSNDLLARRRRRRRRRRRALLVARLLARGPGREGPIGRALPRRPARAAPAVPGGRPARAPPLGLPREPSPPPTLAPPPQNKQGAFAVTFETYVIPSVAWSIYFRTQARPLGGGRVVKWLLLVAWVGARVGACSQRGFAALASRPRSHTRRRAGTTLS